MPSLTELASYLESIAPAQIAESWDNVGVLVRCAQEVTGVLCALDITPATVREARAVGCNAIVSHHPVIFRPLKELRQDDVPALLVREVPADIDAADTVPTLEEFAERLRTGRSPDEKREALLHTMACKAAIKGGWVSDPAELRVLVDRVQSGEIKYCPHGRPVAVKLTKYELEKMFKRA